MDVETAALLGVVEGLTEFLPISSTAHLQLTSLLLFDSVESAFQKTFAIVIQLGAIFAVVALFWRRLLVEPRVLLRVLVAFVPTAIAGLLFYTQIRELLSDVRVILLTLLGGGVAIVLFERRHHEAAEAIADVAQIAWWRVVLIGGAQTLALVPGVSRSAATILGGLALGVSRRTIVEFSFLLAVPTMSAATGYSLWKEAGALTGEQAGLIAVGFVTSFVVALAAICGLLRFIRTHTFIVFGVYRIVLAAVLWFFLVS